MTNIAKCFFFLILKIFFDFVLKFCCNILGSLNDKLARDVQTSKISDKEVFCLPSKTLYRITISHQIGTAAPISRFFLPSNRLLELHTKFRDLNLNNICFKYWWHECYFVNNKLGYIIGYDNINSASL